MKKYIILILILILSFNLFGCMYQPAATAVFDFSDNKTKSENKNKEYKYDSKYFSDKIETEYQTKFRYSVVRCKGDNDIFYKTLCTYLNNFGGEIVYGYPGIANTLDRNRDTIIVKLPKEAPYIENLQEMLYTYIR